MRIKKVELIDNPKIKNIKLDFTIDNAIQDTIILAGNNGCGKTSILEDIFYSISCSSDIRQNGKIVCYLEFNDEEIELMKENIRKNARVTSDKTICISALEKYREYEYILDFNGERGTYDRYKIYAINETEKVQLDSYTIMDKGKMQEIMSAFYSTANINYNLNRINSITTMDLDLDRKNIITNDSIGTDIKQTFIDIYNLDAQDYLKYASEHVGEKIDKAQMFPRIKRFSNAFSYMFENIKFDRIINQEGYKDVIFKNSKGEEIKIDDLSTGEKQIIIRGGYILKFQKSIQTNFILIDEPELSLHPEWQKKILQFYKRLFTTEDGKQTAQIIIATHSPFIIHNSSRYNDKVIILNKDNNDDITVLDEPVFYSCDNNQIVEKAFNIKDWKINKNIIFTEGETDEKYIKKAIELFFNGNVNFDVKWIGKYNNNGNPINTGSSGLDNLLKVLDANPNLINNKVGLLYDCDTNKENIENSNYFTYTLKQLPNTTIKRGIENQFVLPDSFDIEDFVDRKTECNEYGVENSIGTLNKKKLCDYICASKDNKSILLNLKDCISLLIKKFEN